MEGRFEGRRLGWARTTWGMIWPPLALTCSLGSARILSAITSASATKCTNTVSGAFSSIVSSNDRAISVRWPGGARSAQRSRLSARQLLSSGGSPP